MSLTRHAGCLSFITYSSSIDPLHCAAHCLRSYMKAFAEARLDSMRSIETLKQVSQCPHPMTLLRRPTHHPKCRRFVTTCPFVLSFACVRCPQKYTEAARELAMYDLPENEAGRNSGAGDSEASVVTPSKSKKHVRAKVKRFADALGQHGNQVDGWAEIEASDASLANQAQGDVIQRTTSAKMFHNIGRCAAAAATAAAAAALLALLIHLPLPLLLLQRRVQDAGRHNKSAAGGRAPRDALHHGHYGCHGGDQPQRRRRHLHPSLPPLLPPSSPVPGAGDEVGARPLTLPSGCSTGPGTMPGTVLPLLFSRSVISQGSVNR